MNLKRFFAVPEHSTFASTALLLLRVVGGIAFMLHGWSKIQNPFGWMPGSSIPGIFQALAALSEFGGGLAWALGLLTPLASLGLVFTMAVAFFFHAVQRGDPFVGKGAGPSSELAAVYFCIALLLIAIGPGRFALDRLVFGSRSRET
jgi:putative oxidoreductase